MFTGNRGIIHDPATKTLTRRWASQAWLTCVCEFRGRRRDVMGGRSWTELFFLDEATALAAGHRPCFYCAATTRTGFAPLGEGQWRRQHSRREIDAVLHRERLDRRPSGCTHCQCRWKNCPMARCCSRVTRVLRLCRAARIRGRRRVIAQSRTRLKTRCC